MQKIVNPYLISFRKGRRAKLASQAILLYKKLKIWAQNSIYSSYYKHIKVHTNGFKVQVLLLTNAIDKIKQFIAVWLGQRLWKKAKNTDFWHFFTKMRFSQNAILALFQNENSKISITVARNLMKFYTNDPHILV